jgi:hypothetical protein
MINLNRSDQMTEATEIDIENYVKIYMYETHQLDNLTECKKP